MAAILNSAILDSALHFGIQTPCFLGLRFTQKHSHSTLTLTQTNSNWLKLIHSHQLVIQPSWILPSQIQTLQCWNSDTLLSSLRFTQKHSPSTLTLTQTNSFWLKLIHSHCNLMIVKPSWILPSWIQLLHCGIQTPCFLLSDSLKNTLPLLWLWLQTNSIWLKLIHSHSTWWWQPSEFCHLGPSWNQPSWFFLSNTLRHLAKIGSHHLHKKNSHSHFPPHHLNKKLHSFILTQLDDGGHLEFGHLEFCHLGFSFCIMELRHLVFFSQIHSKTLSLHSDSDSN